MARGIGDAVRPGGVLVQRARSRGLPQAQGTAAFLDSLFTVRVTPKGLPAINTTTAPRCFEAAKRVTDIHRAATHKRDRLWFPHLNP